ncbi:MAG: hypothetical protein ACTSRI_17315 [Promethearchaeota archaeon]
MVSIPSKLRKKFNIQDGSIFIDLEDLFGVDSKELGYEIIREIYEERRKEKKRNLRKNK